MKMISSSISKLLNKVENEILKIPNKITVSSVTQHFSSPD